LREVVVGDRRPADRHDVGAEIECALHIQARIEVTGDGEAHRPSVQVGEQLQQRPGRELLVGRLLEDIPEREVDEIDCPRSDQPLERVNHIGGGHPESLGREPHAQQEVRTATSADARDDLLDDAEPRLAAPAVVVGAIVERGVEEFAEQVVVCAVQFDAVEPCRVAPFGRGDERFDDLVHLGERQSSRPGAGVIGGRDGRGADEVGRCPTSRVVQLDDRDAALRADPGRQAGEPRDVLVAEAAQLPREALTARLDVAGTGHGHTEPALGAHRQPALLVVGQRPVGVALLIRQGGQHESVLHGRPVDEGHRVKRVWHWRSSTIAGYRARPERTVRSGSPRNPQPEA
jgi:hypothetical protein